MKKSKIFQEAVFMNVQAMQENVILIEIIATALCVAFSLIYIFKHLNLSIVFEAILSLIILRGTIPYIWKQIKEYIQTFKINLEELKKYRRR